ncbi:hypothetical protein HN789_01420 [archaeon]|jgi:hypothetical protein|nr:hypothetical protein [archaeon]MBT4022191.1 hypothetical protein [archaeon]MBT4272804.1 hypothetical protein [archaeon]MBT4461603.1 hypothetical protein [archaeon]MBT4857629.1 hypothetical protein [archaeon]
MINIKKLYHELLFTTLIISFFDAALTGLAAFGLSYIFVYFYRLEYYFSIIFAVIVFIRSFYLKSKQNKILLLEDKYPDLKERLRTSFDYQKRSNPVIDSLHYDIFKRMKRVDVNAYLNPKKLTIKIFVICIALTTVLSLAAYGVDIYEVKLQVQKSEVYRRAGAIVDNIFEKRDEIFDRPWLKDPRLIGLGSKENNVTIDTYNTELDISEIGQPEKNDYGGHYPEEIKGAAQEVYEEGIPTEHKDVIKEYFKKINE